MESLKHLTHKILLSLVLGIIVGLTINYFLPHAWIKTLVVEGLFDLLGEIFLTMLKMIIVPVVFISLVCGTFHLKHRASFRRIAFKTLTLYVVTTAIAISLALLLANFFHIGKNVTVLGPTEVSVATSVPSVKAMILNLFPSNPVKALADGNLLQIIFFSLLLGVAINRIGEKSERIKRVFNEFNDVIMHLVILILMLSPVGVFCLVAKIFSVVGFSMVQELLGYFVTVLAVLLLQLFVVYPLLLMMTARLSPRVFYKKMFGPMLFAFSTSSSSASIPVVLNAVENKLGVNDHVAAFVVPLGATLNMDGTAIMQGVATVFIANLSGVDLSAMDFFLVILTATLASIGTAGIPGVGLITLTVVLTQVGLPVDKIGLILGVDRLLDMTRTAVNISGDSIIACIVGKTENSIDLARYSGELTD